MTDDSALEKFRCHSAGGAKKVIRSFLINQPLNDKLMTDRRTDRRTTDNSALEKLRCLSAGGANKRAVLIEKNPYCISI